MFRTKRVGVVLRTLNKEKQEVGRSKTRECYGQKNRAGGEVFKTKRVGVVLRTLNKEKQEVGRSKTRECYGQKNRAGGEVFRAWWYERRVST